MSALLPLGRLCLVSVLLSSHLCATAATEDTAAAQSKPDASAAGRPAATSRESREADAPLLLLAGLAAVFFVARRRLHPH